MLFRRQYEKFSIVKKYSKLHNQTKQYEMIDITDMK